MRCIQDILMETTRHGSEHFLHWRPGQPHRVGCDDSEWEGEHLGCPLVEMGGVAMVYVTLEGLQRAFDEEPL